MYDETYLLDDKVLGEYDALNLHSILSTGTYGDLKSYHDEFDKSFTYKKIRVRKS